MKTKDPKQGWSDPIKLKFGGIDPCIFFDEDGKAYIVHNDAPNKGEEKYSGHRVIKIWEYDHAAVFCEGSEKQSGLGGARRSGLRP